jgi:hypothetical protein
MRRASAFAGALILAGMASSASAATVNVTETLVYSGGSPNAPLFGAPAPVTSDPNFTQGFIGTVTNSSLSPYFYNTSVIDQARPYNVLSPGGSDPGGSFAIYNLASGATSFQLLWGSPDTYNKVNIFDQTNTALQISGASADGGTGLLGSDLACYASACTHDHWVLITFNIVGDGFLGSFKLIDTNGQAAFEFGLQDQPGGPTTTPLPAAVWLLGSVLAGGAGFGRWRKRKAKSAAA